MKITNTTKHLDKNSRYLPEIASIIENIETVFN